MLQELAKFFVSGFVYPNITLTGLALGIGLSIAFGAIWLVGYRPPVFKKPWLWAAVAASSAVLTWAACTFVQYPLSVWTNQALGHFLSQQTMARLVLVTGIPLVLLSGLVQEAFKLLPVVFLWLRNKKNLTVKNALIIGAISGAGFGVFEAVWALNTFVFTPGWNWGMVGSQGFMALAPFCERFFAVAFHIASCALAGYGLAKGWGWQFYLIAAFVHGLVNYSVVLFQTHVLTMVQMEMWIATIAALLTVVVLWLRWKRTADIVDEGIVNATLAPLKLGEVVMLRVDR